ncbi:MAG: TraB/GumN family protein [Saprospiraceae bacterium]|nr:TraB/GumN family protein [Saprospiraceae bacterium]
MKHLLSFLSLTLSLLFQAFAQPSAAVSTEENSLLWEISGKDLKQPSYLFGTIHMINKKDFILTDITKSSLSKTQQIAFEINMEEMSDFSVLMPLMMKAFMADGKTLRDLVSEEDYKLVKAHFDEIGLPLMMLERIKPMFLSAMGAGDMSEMQSNGEMVSYEIELMKLAKAQEKPVAGLETAEFQMSMFDSIPYEAQAEMLVESIKSGKEGDDQFDQLVELYKKQDLNGLQKMLEGDGSIAQYEDLLLVKRNKNWIPVMAKMMTTNPTFFAVGAGHLGGKQGVIALLRQEGYKVKPLK